MAKDTVCIDELLSKIDEFLSLEKTALAGEKQLSDYKQLTDNLLFKIASLSANCSTDRFACDEGIA